MRQGNHTPRLVGMITMTLVLAGARGDAQATAPRRAFQVTYVAHIDHLPATANEVQVWVPLATTRDGQRVVRRTVQTAVPYDIATEPMYGNEMLHATLQAPVRQPVEFLVEYEAVVQGGNRLTAPSATVSPAMQAMSLQAERLTVIDETVRRLAAEATRGRATTLDRARGIYDAVIRRMRYDKTTPGWGRGDVARACVVGRGHCTDFHALFIAMARAAGIPARFKIGATIPTDPSATVPGYHCWAEFYLPEHGWIPVDASEAWKHPERAGQYFGAEDENKFTISLGRDMRLVPPQRGEPVNIFIKPYVEVDGKPFEDVQIQFRFRNESPQQGGSHEG